MAQTDKLELEEVAVGTTGWNAIYTANNQKIDDGHHAILMVTLGETVAQYEAGCFYESTGKWHKALANISKQPAWGVFLDAGNLDDEVRLQRIGPVTNAGWSWTAGKPVYLSAGTPGALTQTAPADRFKQFIGMPETATKLILNPDKPVELFVTTTTTSTTSSLTRTTAGPSSS